MSQHYTPGGTDEASIAGGITKAQYDQLTAQLDAEQAASGLSRVDFYAHLQATHDPRLAALSSYVPDGGRPNFSTVSKNLPWMLPAAGFGVSLASGAGGAGAAGAGGASPSFAGDAAAATAGIDSTLGAGVVGGMDLGAAGTAGLSTTGGGLLGRLAGIIKNPAEIAKLAALVPAFKTLTGDGSNGNNPFAAGSPLMDEATKSVALGNKRMEQAQPVYDSLVNMAYGRMPTRYRGAAPSGYSGDAAPEGAYQYTAPKFG